MKITTVAVCDCTVCLDICNLEDLKDEDYHCGCVVLPFQLLALPDFLCSCVPLQCNGLD